jgi:hypothetical protein
MSLSVAVFGDNHMLRLDGIETHMVLFGQRKLCTATEKAL